MSEVKRNSVAALIQKLSTMNPDAIICNTYITASDVREVAKADNVALTDDQVNDILIEAESKHDMNNGITLDTLSCYVSQYEQLT